MELFMEYIFGIIIGLVIGIGIMYFFKRESTMFGWVARQKQTDDQYGHLMLFLQRPMRNQTTGTWFGHEGAVLNDEGKFGFVKWENEPVKVRIIINEF